MLLSARNDPEQLLHTVLNSQSSRRQISHLSLTNLRQQQKRLKISSEGNAAVAGLNQGRAGGSRRFKSV